LFTKTVFKKSFQPTETGQARPPAERSEADGPEPRNICHQGTKTRRILFCYSFLVSWWLCGEKKNCQAQRKTIFLKFIFVSWRQKYFPIKNEKFTSNELKEGEHGKTNYI
jgi:hypothetical protein